LSSLLKTLIKGKQKAIDPKDNIIDWEQVEVSPKISFKNSYNQAAGSSKSKEYEHASLKNTPKKAPKKAPKQVPKQASSPGSSRNITGNVPNRPVYIKDSEDDDRARFQQKRINKDEKVTKKTKSQPRLKRSRSRDKNRSTASSSSSSSSPSPSLSAASSSSSSRLQAVLFYEDMNKDLRNALRVTDLFHLFHYFICLNRFVFYD
jgi:hypothetical protein